MLRSKRAGTASRQNLFSRLDSSVSETDDAVCSATSTLLISKAARPFPWPLNPQNGWHEVTGVVGEARGAPGGIALHHLHSGLDIRGNVGDPVLSVIDEKVSRPIAAWGYGGSNEGIQIGLMSYIHIRVGRNAKSEVGQTARFKAKIRRGGKSLKQYESGAARGSRSETS